MPHLELVLKLESRKNTVILNLPAKNIVNRLGILCTRAVRANLDRSLFIRLGCPDPMEGRG